MNKQHYPRVRILTPTPTGNHEVTLAVLTTVEVDGREWPCVSYLLDSGKASPSDGFQTVTLTFVADVTVEHR